MPLDQRAPRQLALGLAISGVLVCAITITVVFDDGRHVILRPLNSYVAVGVVIGACLLGIAARLGLGHPVWRRVAMAGSTILAVGAIVVGLIRHYGGAISSPRTDAGAAGHRDAPFSITIENSGSHLPAGIGAVFYKVLRDPSRVGVAFTPTNLIRVRQVKRDYDPSNFFHVNHNIAPAAVGVLTRA